MLTMNESQISVSTPEVLWHGGGNENGKPDPVYSVDFHPQEHIMCTTGIDANVPPKGSVRIWKVDSGSGGQEFLLDLCDHQSAVNVARFSPDGKMLASASDRQIVVYVVENPSIWNHIQDVVPLERLWLRPALNEVFDIQWSPDSTHLVVGAIDCKAEIIRLSTRDSLMLPGHTSYIQGVAWDPRGEHVVTQSADRSCKVHKVKARSGAMVKLAPRGHVVMRMHLGYTVPDSSKKVLTAADFGIAPSAPASCASSTATTAPVASSDAVTVGGEAAAAAPAPAGVNLFADSYVPSFFRRVCCSPDGALIIAPTGIHHPPGSKPAKDAAGRAVPSGNSFCTHLFARDNLASPCLSLVGLEEPSVAVRCFARPYKLVKHPIGSAQSTNTSMIGGDYRFMFAVVTLGSVFVYDTQHTHPIAKFAGLHYAPINDAAWSEDGRVLVVCSSDGYLSFFRFEHGALGELLDDALVPEVIKRAHPCLFHYVPPVVTEEARIPSADAEAEAEAAEDAGEEAADVGVVEGTGAGAESVAQADSGATESASSSVQADTAAPVDAKKRKRIQPTVLSGPSACAVSSFASSSTGSAAATSGSVPCGSPVKVAATAATTGDSSSTVPTSNTSGAGSEVSAEKKQKKRIAPQLVQAPTTSASVASTSEGGAMEGAPQ